MAEAARYMFDRTFESPTRGSESSEAVAARKLQEETERKMAEACCTAYEEGRAEGEAAALKRIEEATRAETAMLVECSQKLLDRVERECDHVRCQAIELATMTANLLAEQLIARMPLLNLEALFADALEHMNDAPHIAVTVNDTLAEAVQKTVTSLARERGFKGKIVVLGDPETKQGDCALQWADGGIALDFEKTRAEVSRIVRRHLDRLNTQATDPPPNADKAEAPGANGASAPGHNQTQQHQPETETASPAMTGAGEPR